MSEPVNIGGSLQRSTARVMINGKIDSNLYTKEEIKLLSGIDEALDKVKASGPKQNYKTEPVKKSGTIRKSDLLKFEAASSK